MARKRKLTKTKKERKNKWYSDARAKERQAKVEFNNREGSYKSGQNIEPGAVDGYTLDKLLAAAAAPAAKRPKKKTRVAIICPYCQRCGHKTNRSSKCKFYNQVLPPVILDTNNKGSAEEQRKIQNKR
jgi:hypothetical protein